MSERAERIIAGDVELEAALHVPDGATGPVPGVVVCHPHPQYGGDMENNVVMTVVDALVERGIAALRFNLRGTGRSGGRHEGGRGERDDVRAALALAAARPEVDGARVGLAGYSFGALMAASVAGPSLPALALIAPPLAVGSGLPPELSGYGHPLLLLAGDDDPFCPATALCDTGHALGELAEARVVPGADHSWFGYEPELERLVGGFFAARL